MEKYYAYGLTCIISIFYVLLTLDLIFSQIALASYLYKVWDFAEMNFFLNVYKPLFFHVSNLNGMKLLSLGCECQFFISYH